MHSEWSREVGSRNKGNIVLERSRVLDLIPSAPSLDDRKGTYQSPVPEGIVITSRSRNEGIVLLAQVLECDGKWVSLAVYDHYLSAPTLLRGDRTHDRKGWYRGKKR